MRLFANPTIVVADEPTGSLDDETSEQILDVLERVNSELGMTLLMVTHDSSIGQRARRRVPTRTRSAPGERKRNEGSETENGMTETASPREPGKCVFPVHRTID